MSSDNSSDRNKVSFSKTKKANNDLFTGLLTEDNVVSGTRILDVMANDQGSGKSLYSLDNGSNSLKDLLTQDLGRTASQSADKSAMGATIWITSDGKVAYDASSFSAATLARLNHLSAGESLTDTFTYAIRLSDGTLSWATASVRIDGVNDPAVITSGAQNGAATEIADGALGENAATHTSSGVITFTDAEKHDSHTVSVAPNGAGYLGTFSAYLADGDDDNHNHHDDDGDDDGHHSNGEHCDGDRNESSSDSGAVKWTFSVDDSAIDRLAAGQTLTQTYNVVINDGHGGTTTQVVTITLTGTNDVPVITSAAQSGSVSEGDDGASRTATGQVTFSDVDLIDTHTLSVGVAAAHGAASVDADGIWHYTVNDTGAVDALAAGAHLADSFTVQVADNNGGIATQVVNIDIVGTNDAPVAVADTNALDAVVESGAIQPTVAGGMVGTWLGEGAPFSVLSLFADGRYMYMEGDGQAPNGGEAGTWVYDAAAGKLALNCAFDNNIGGGLAPDQNGIFNPVAVNGNESSLTINGGAVTLVGVRQAVTTGIVGTWVAPATADEPFTALILFDDNRFMYMEGAGLPPNGLEAGTYSYDASLGVLTFTTTFDNNNDSSGSGGLSPGVNGVALTAVINGDTLSISNGNFHFPPLSRQFSGTQNATIDPAFAGDASAVGNVLANDTDVDAGAILTVSEVNGLAGNVGATIVGTYGSVTINSDGGYAYTLNNADPDTNALAQGASASDVFNYTVTDEFGATSYSTLTIAIAGANDAPVAVDNTRSATENGGIANGLVGSNATGNVLVNDTDADTAHASLTVTAIRTGFTEGFGTAGTVGSGVGLAGAHGKLFMNANGGYSYLVNQFDPAVQALNSTGQNTSLTDVFNYTVSDGGRTDTAVLTITIHGANDAPVVTAPVTLTAIAEDSGARLITQAQLLAHAYDVDSPNLSAIGLAISSGNGALVNNNDGTWSYTPALNDDTAVTFSYSVTDGVAPAVATSAALDITPVNDAATITGMATGSVMEDGALTAGGVLAANDVDTDENHFQTPASLSGTYGEFTFNAASGVWGYTLNNSAANVQALGATDVVHDTMTVTSFDGTASQNIDVTIAGTDEAPAGIGRALAVAYDDHDGNNIYDSAADTLYFGVFDTNGDGVASAGDTLRADFYPANVAASTLFEFQHKELAITAVDGASNVLFVVAGNELVVFSKASDGEAVENSTLSNYNSGGPNLVLMDVFVPLGTTGIFATPDEVYISAGWTAASTLAPTGPQTAVDDKVYQPGNQPWLNVDFLIV